MTRTPGERVKDQVDEQMKEASALTELSSQQQAIDPAQQRKLLLALAGLGIGAAGATGAGIGAVGGALSPRGSGFFPGAARGAGAGVGGALGMTLGSAAGGLAGIENPMLRTALTLGGGALGGYAGYRAGKKLTKTQPEMLEEAMLDWYAKNPQVNLNSPPKVALAAFRMSNMDVNRPNAQAASATAVSPMPRTPAPRPFTAPTPLTGPTGNRATDAAALQQNLAMARNPSAFQQPPRAVAVQSPNQPPAQSPVQPAPAADSGVFTASSGRQMNSDGSFVQPPPTPVAREYSSRQQVLSQYPQVGVAGTPENQKFVAAYKEEQQRTGNRYPDSAAVAARVFGSPSAPAVAASPTAAPALPAPWTPGSGRPNPNLVASAPATSTPASAPAPVTSTPAASAPTAASAGLGPQYLLQKGLGFAGNIGRNALNWVAANTMPGAQH